MTIKKEEVFQAFFAAGLEGDYNFLEDDLLKLAKVFGELRDNELNERVYRATQQERNRCIEFVRSLNPTVAQALQDKKGPL
jgi:flagellar motor switch protein FliG